MSPGTTVAARPAHHPGPTQAAHAPRLCPLEFLFFFFSFRSFSFLFLWELECIYFSKPRMEAWRAGFTVSVLLRASQGFLP